MWYGILNSTYYFGNSKRLMTLMLFEEKSELFRKNLNASKPSEHPPQVEECLKV